MEIKKNKKDRGSYFVKMFIGTNNTGKSATAYRIAKAWKQKNPSGLIVAFDPQNRFKGLRDYRILSTIDGVEEMIDKEGNITKVGNIESFIDLENTLFIFDDYRLLHPNGVPEKWLDVLMAFRAERQNDFIFICHSPKRVIEYLTYYINYYYIYYVLGKSSDFSDKIPSYELCLNASKEVQNEVVKNGFGIYPNFKFSIVNVNKNNYTNYGF